MIMYNDELYHTGRKGMKWGQHIYAKDGSLNRRGRRKFNRVANSAKKSKAHTAQAKKMLKKYSRYEEKNANDYQKEANYKSKDYQSAERQRNNAKWAKEAIQKSNMYKKAYKDIKNGKLKAGKDFIMTNFKDSKIYNTDILFKDKKNNYSPYVGLLYDQEGD